MAFVFTILASVFLITSSGFVCVIQAQGVSLLVSPPILRGSETLVYTKTLFSLVTFTQAFLSYLSLWPNGESAGLPC